MESRHDSENSERILYNMTPKQLVRINLDPRFLSFYCACSTKNAISFSMCSKSGIWINGQYIYSQRFYTISIQLFFTRKALNIYEIISCSLSGKHKTSLRLNNSTLHGSYRWDSCGFWRKSFSRRTWIARSRIPQPRHWRHHLFMLYKGK